MDIRISTPESCFILRSAALFLHDGHLLAVAAADNEAYYTVGGKVRLGETTEQCAVREAYEETGVWFEAERLLYVQERFNQWQGREHHEVVFFYLMKGDAFAISDGVPTDQPDSETLHWLKLDRLAEEHLLPDFLKMALEKLPQQPMHIITDERGKTL